MQINHVLFLAVTAILCLLNFALARLGADYLKAFFVVQGIIANIFIVKEVVLFGMTVTSTDPFIIGMLLSLNLLQEKFGSEQAMRTIYLFFSMTLIVPIVTTMLLFMQPAPTDLMQQHLVAIFGLVPRIMISSLVVGFFTMQLDRYLYSLLGKYFGKRLWIKNLLASSISQLFDTILFSYLALFGVISDLYSMMLFSYAVKLLAIIFSFPFIMMHNLQDEI